MTDIVYRLKSPSMELRYSLRSLEKFGSNVGNVYVMSPKHVPFLSENVMQVNYERIYKEPFKDRLYALLHINDNYNLSENAIYIADDVFYLKPFDCNKTHCYVKRELPKDRIENITEYGDGFKNLLFLTRNVLDLFGIDSKYDCSEHMGIFCKNYIFKKYRDIFEYILHNTESGVDNISLIVNLMINDGIQPEYRKDIKFRDDKIWSKEETNSIINTSDVVSTDTMSFLQYPGDCIYKLFTEKSKFENDCTQYIRKENYL